MNRYLAFFSTIILVMCFCAGKTLLAQSTMFSTGFEDTSEGGYPSGWINAWSGEAGFVTDSNAHSGSKSFFSESYQNWSRVDYYPLSNLPDHIVFEAWLYPSETSDDHSIALFNKSNATWGSYYSWVEFSKDGKIRAGSSSALGTYEASRWYHVKVDANFTDGTMTVWINDSILTANAPTGPKEYDSFAIRTGNQINGSSTYFDDITITDMDNVTSALWLPVASHGQGQGNSQWRTDLGLLNPSSSAANVTLSYYQNGEVAANMNVNVPASGQLILTDVLDQLGMTGSGPISIQSQQSLKVTSRTYDLLPGSDPCSPNGTFGQGIPGYSQSDALTQGQTAYLPQLVENSKFRTNIGITNIGTDQATVTVSLYGSKGTQLGVYAVVLQPGEWKQASQPFLTIAGQNTVDAGYATITANSGSAIIAYASVVDNVTNDPTAILMTK